MLVRKVTCLFLLNLLLWFVFGQFHAYQNRNNRFPDLRNYSKPYLALSVYPKPGVKKAQVLEFFGEYQNYQYNEDWMASHMETDVIWVKESKNNQFIQYDFSQDPVVKEVKSEKAPHEPTANPPTYYIFFTKELEKDELLLWINSYPYLADMVEYDSDRLDRFPVLIPVDDRFAVEKRLQNTNLFIESSWYRYESS